ncbi:hypothetical protein E8E13_006792 [Curvularia kusanoi]|uniref:Uncharacterized protein n=1 Tax=Curvularia kusanoi TaxID=90978 RepID=A0A9P4TKK6_CURKU|nr:hypothetical protein E8E13_006792 [Curvularia kusanoi]
MKASSMVIGTQQEPSPTGILPIDIAKEALRLYPPSRRVHREFDGKLFHADIEACHRLGLLSGDDPLTFRPERWQSICPHLRKKDKKNKLKDEERRFGFMPFAKWCRADTKETKAFAMKMILMLVAVLCDKLGDDWKLADKESLPELGVALESSRDAYGDLRLDKV